MATWKALWSLIVISLAVAQFLLTKARSNGERKYAGGVLGKKQDTSGGQPRLYTVGKTVFNSSLHPEARF